MLFYIVDDDDATRAMLGDIIEDEDLGTVVGEAVDGAMLDEYIFDLKQVDILLLDLLMPIKDGLETVHDISPVFKGKIIMISQIESKELVAQAYSNGIVYYITKPINKTEILSVIKNVIENIYLEKSVYNIHQLAGKAIIDNPIPKVNYNSLENDYIPYAQGILSDLNIVGENGYQDLLDILDYLFKYKEEKTLKDDLPNMKDIYCNVVQERHEIMFESEEFHREIKASKQRVRRAIYHSLTHLSSLGLHDFMNPTFENYSSKFFDFSIVQKRMHEIKNKDELAYSQIRINTKKFIQVLYFETQRLMLEA